MKRQRSNWQDQFEPHILERGLDYFEQGLVHDIKQSGNMVTAVVSGSKDYAVQLKMSRGELSLMECTCPYADDGSACKHMAALCFAVEDGLVSPPASTITGRAKSELLAQTINKLTAARVRQLLLTLAADDEDMQNRILVLADRPPEDLLSSLKSKVDRIAEDAECDDGYIDYREAWDFTDALKELLEDDAGLLLSRGLVMDSFALTCYAFMTAAGYDIDDSDGGLSMLGQCCADLWQEQVEAATPAQREQMYDWFANEVKQSPSDWQEDLLWSMQLSLFGDRGLLEKSLTQADRRLAAAEAKVDKSAWDKQYELTGAVMDRLRLMRELHCPEAEIAAFQTRYHGLHEVRKLEVDQHLRQGNNDAAIVLLKESKEMDA